MAVAFFGAALVCAVLALIASSIETILSGRAVREEASPDAKPMKES